MNNATSPVRPTLTPLPAARPPAALAFDIDARLRQINIERMRHARLARFRTELAKLDVAGALLSDPINIRYATDARNMAVWSLHSIARYAFVPTHGPVVLFEMGSTQHVTRGLSTIGELRPSTPWSYMIAMDRIEEKCAQWADEIVDLVRTHGSGNRRLAVDRCEPLGIKFLTDRGLTLLDAQQPIEVARAIKTPDEIDSMKLVIDVCDEGVRRMRDALQPGITENQLWSILHETNIAHDGEWIECRLLSSGSRTNPWFQECGTRVIQAGDVVGFDTDMVGPLGYVADISRSWVCPGRPPSDRHRRLYETAEEQIAFNMALLRPGLGFREFAEKAWKVPDAYAPQRYLGNIHGLGLVDEYPVIPFIEDFSEWGSDGVFVENMVVSVESYIGELGGQDGIKLEEQVLITDRGAVSMSKSAFHDALEAT
ncbi:MAG TPA: Xaa-Pro peptidase family protein [Steroidobacteraceae bacterium]|nr:Xaa-Pro peptidase family protein [Steroidobacteraceae bacterium]